MSNPPGQTQPAILRRARGRGLLTAPTRFPGAEASVAQVRDWARRHLGDHPLEYNVRIVLSELATNAVQHTCSGRPGGIFRVAMFATDGLVRVSVQDEGAREVPAVRTQVADDSENGRGLMLVDLLTGGRWGVHHIVGRGGHPCGRVVWAELR